jgi:Cu-Zn family superoxide dismutase
MKKRTREIIPMKRKNLVVAFLGMFLTALAASGEEVTVKMNRITDQGIGGAIGKITLTETKHGVVLLPVLKGLKPGIHGFHVHEKADCGPGVKDGKVKAGMAAGAHFDPAGTGKHEGPFGEGHLGDLPALFVDNEGKSAQTPLLAPRLKLADLKGRSLMVHQGGDTYSEKPELGGGGARVACGIMP